MGDSLLIRPMKASAGNNEAGREAEFAEAVRLHQGRIHRLLLGFVRDAGEAESLTQECFLRAYRQWGNFRGECSVATWLSRIAINLARDEARSRRKSFWRRLLALDEESPSKPAEANAIMAAPSGSPEHILLAREQLDAVWAVVDRLPEKQRAAFILRFLEEMSLHEVAEVLEVEVGTVKSHLARAVGAVRREMGRDPDRKR